MEFNLKRVYGEQINLEGLQADLKATKKDRFPYV